MSKARGLATAAVAATLAACTTTTGRERIVQTPPRCADATAQIYFEPQSSELTREGLAVLSEAAAKARGCRVASVVVVGLADAAGAPQANLELSRRRAHAVTAALASVGLPAAEFRVAATGQAGAMTDDGAARPLRRRADVILHLAKP